jgi:hypothetical protein
VAPPPTPPTAPRTVLPQHLDHAGNPAPLLPRPSQAGLPGPVPGGGGSPHTPRPRCLLPRHCSPRFSGSPASRGPAAPGSPPQPLPGPRRRALTGSGRVGALTRPRLRAWPGPGASLPRSLQRREADRRACRTDRPPSLAHPLERAQPGQPARRHVLAVPCSCCLHRGHLAPPYGCAPGAERHLHVPHPRPPSPRPTRRPGVEAQGPATRLALGLHEGPTFWLSERPLCPHHPGEPALEGGAPRRDSCAPSHARRPRSALLLSPLGRGAAGQHAGAAGSGRVWRDGLRGGPRDRHLCAPLRLPGPGTRAPWGRLGVLWARERRRPREAAGVAHAHVLSRGLAPDQARPRSSRGGAHTAPPLCSKPLADLWAFTPGFREHRIAGTAAGHLNP